jgi:ectoine hydroxylase-related dioxygenase (phytanoyl-CoA dioxygenase family)
MKEIRTMALTTEEKAFYATNGFLLKKKLVPPDWITQVRQELTHIHERMADNPPEGVHVAWEDLPPDQPKRIRQLMHSEVVSPTLNKILRSEAMLDLVAELMAPDISLYHSKLLPKEAGLGAAVPWHQDYAYWKNPENFPLMINCQMAIDAATIENGCLEFIPGSHKWGLQEHERHQEAFGVFLPGRYYKRPEAVVVEMEPGDGVFFTSLIIHGSAPNKSDKSRWANTFAFNVTGNNVKQCREVLRGKPLP